MGTMTDETVPRGVWWHVYPLGFLGAERFALPAGSPVSHRLPNLVQWLDYSVELGIEGWILGPVFASSSHGYDTIDHQRIDPRLGDADDLANLIQAAHDRGLRIVLDGVFNHVGRDFEPFARTLADGPGSEFAHWFRIDWEAEDGPRAANFEGHDQLVALDHSSGDVAAYVNSVLDRWAAIGVDGWRFDAAYAVPTPFWCSVTGTYRPDHPGCWLFGEVIHGDYVEIVREGGLDSVTQYELWKAIASSINDANFYELAHALGRHNEFLDVFVPVTFLGNHDTTRIASTLQDHAHLPHALAILFTVGGTPVIYAGDEQGYTGVKYEREGGDDEVRPPFPDSPAEFSLLGHATHELHRTLIDFRNARPWLADARTEVIELANPHLVYVSTGKEPGQRVASALNVSAEPVQLPLPDGDWRPIAGPGEPGPDGVRLPAHGWVVLSDGRPG